MTNAENLLARHSAFQHALHEWYRVNHRKLPWRDAPSLYKTVVSELMLQQTQITTALPYFHRWLRDLPDFAALAAASESQVLKLWEGLGYYSRARNLHKLAQAVAAMNEPPRTPALWRELPGIGPYTAAAITSIAFDEPAACVDGNVVRVLARLLAEDRLFRDSSEAAKYFTPLADGLIADSHPGTHNQAMMELGATICLRPKPLCLVCPVADFCAGRESGAPEKFPRLQPKKIEQLTLTRLWCEQSGALLLRRGQAGAKRLAGMFELPEASDLGLTLADNAALLATKRRAITRFQITEFIHTVAPTPALQKKITANPHLEWIALDQLDVITLSGPHKRWIQELRKSSAPKNPSKEINLIKSRVAARRRA